MNHAERLRQLADRMGLDGYAEELREIAGEMEAQPPAQAEQDALLQATRLQALEDAANRCRAVAEGFGGLAAGPFCTDFGKHTHQSMAAGALNCAADIDNMKGQQ